MSLKRIALPLPPSADTPPPPVSAGEGLEATNPQEVLGALMQRREALALELGILDAQVQRAAVESVCGGQDDTQDVELYDGSLGVGRAFVDAHEPPVGQLQWLSDLPQRFSGPGESPGNVNGARWGSGGLIADDLDLTAGHCFDQSGGGWQRPQRNGATVQPSEIATLMRLNFNFQVNGVTGQVRPDISFPVTELLGTGSEGWTSRSCASDAMPADAFRDRSSAGSPRPRRT